MTPSYALPVQHPSCVTRGPFWLGNHHVNPCHKAKELWRGAAAREGQDRDEADPRAAPSRHRGTAPLSSPLAAASLFPALRATIEPCFLSARRFLTALSILIMFEQPQLANLPISAASLSAQDKAPARPPAWQGTDGHGGQGERWSCCCWGWCGVSSGRGTWQEPPAVPAQPGEVRHRVWRGCKRATKASLEGALWASRGSALISWAQRFPSAPAPTSPSCSRHLAWCPSQLHPTSQG